ncbi:MAG: GNAT family N-acetyltransferase [Steroidobacteraceae bacterium]|jgi:GNAT superfamily N-acetyltransferase
MDMAATSPPYPIAWERAALTRDNVAYRIRPIRPDDSARERAFIVELSPESRYTRLMTAMREPTAALVERLVHVDYQRNMAFVAVLGAGTEERIIGVARYCEDRVSGSEFAVVVMDDWQARGVAVALSELLFEYARAHGVRDLHATMLATNTHMIELAHWLGMTTHRQPDDPTLVTASRRL